MKEKPFTPSELLQRINVTPETVRLEPYEHRTFSDWDATREDGDPRFIGPRMGDLSYPSIEEQKAYWEDRDKDLDKIESCSAWFEEIDRKLPF